VPEALTKMEAVTLEQTIALMREKAYPPTAREVAVAMGVSTSLVAQRFTAMRQKGYITREFNRGRAFRVLFGSDGSPLT